MFVSSYIELASKSEEKLKEAFLKVAGHHKEEPDIEETCKELASWSEKHFQSFAPIMERYIPDRDEEPENLHKILFQGTRSGGLGLLRDLHDLFLLASEVMLSYTVIMQAALALRDEELEEICLKSMKETERQINWIKTRIKQAAPQTLVAA